MSQSLKIITPLLPLSLLNSPLYYLKDLRLFSNLPEEAIMPFQNGAQARSVQKSKIIYLQDDPAKFFYVVVSGWVKLFRTMPEGQDVIIDLLTTGQTFGDDSIFEHGCHTCCAQVVEAARLLSIPASLLKEQVKLNPSLALNMFTVMSEHHRRHSGDLAFNATLSAPQRVGCFLLRLCVDKNKNEAVFDLPYDKGLIAETLGMKGATFSRSLAMLRTKTGATVNGSSVEIPSIQKLAEYVYGPDSGMYFSKNV